jgi:hypothetical protein
MDHIQCATPSIYPKFNGNGNGNGENGNGRPPRLITGREIAGLTNDADASRRDEIAAKLVLGEAQLVSPTLAQAAALTLSTIHRTRLAAAMKGGNGLVTTDAA